MPETTYNKEGLSGIVVNMLETAYNKEGLGGIVVNMLETASGFTLTSLVMGSSPTRGNMWD